jgi:predicted nucleotidyltransferase
MVDQSIRIEQGKSFFSLCEKLELSLEKAFLFRSYAKNQMREESDIDIILVSEKFSRNRYKDVSLYLKANIQFPLIQVHSYSSSQIREGSDFLNHIKPTAIQIK